MTTTVAPVTTSDRPRRPLYQVISGLLMARANCVKSGNHEWLANHTDRIESLVRNHMPSGSGVDNGTTINLDKSTPDRLVFESSFHHMNGHGYYDGWTDHSVTITPSLFSGIDIRISGQNRNEIKDYLHEIFDFALRTPVED